MVVLVAAFALALSACTSTAELSETVSADLESARTTWSEAGIADYRLVVTSGPNYFSNGCEWTTEITNRSVTRTSATPEAEFSCEETEWTVERLHELVEELQRELRQFEAPEFGQHILAVSYDDTGAPMSIDLDLANGADEELSYQISLLTAS